MRGFFFPDQGPTGPQPDPSQRTSILITRALRLAFAAILISSPLAVPAEAQHVEDSPTVFMGGLPFTVTVQGDADFPLPVEVRTASGTVLGQGTVEAGNSFTLQDLQIQGREDLPLTVVMGD